MSYFDFDPSENPNEWLYETVSYEDEYDEDNEEGMEYDPATGQWYKTL